MVYVLWCEVVRTVVAYRCVFQVCSCEKYEVLLWRRLVMLIVIHKEGTVVAQWLRCCATNRKVAGSIPDGVIGIFHWHNPPDLTMVLRSTQSLTEMSTRRISWGKCGRCLWLTTLPPSCAVVMKSGHLNSWNPLGHSRPVTGLIHKEMIGKFSHPSRQSWRYVSCFQIHMEIIDDDGLGTGV